MKNGKAIDPDDKPVEVRKCLGYLAMKLVTKMFHDLLEGKKMSEEWRKCAIFNNKANVLIAVIMEG